MPGEPLDLPTRPNPTSASISQGAGQTIDNIDDVLRENETKPNFYNPQGDKKGVYDDNSSSPLAPPSSPNPRGGGGDKDTKADSAKALGGQENKGGDKKSAGANRIAGGVSGAAGALASGGGVSGALKGFAKGLVAPKNRKKSATGSGILVAIVAIVFGLQSISSGPFQFLQSAQLLQGFHFADQDDFSDGLTAKFMIYALAGKAAKGRLGVISNARANAWERRLNDTGLKSVYSPTTQRLIGYQVLDEGRARPFLDDMARDGIPRTTTLRGIGIDGNAVDTTGDFVNFQGRRPATARSVTRTAARATGVNRVGAELGSRLLFKRGGVEFHPLLNVVRKKVDTWAKYREDLKEQRAEELRNGTRGTDSPLHTRRVEAANKLRSFAKTATGPALILAVVCSANGLSDSVDAQNLESQQQSIRMGMNRVTIGAQIMSGQDFNAEMLDVHQEDLYDPKTKTSWADDPGIRHEMGEPPTSRSYIDNLKLGAPKPGYFTTYDQVASAVGFIGPVCNAIAAVGDWPIIKQASDLIASIVNSILTGVGAKTTDEYYQMAVDWFANGAVNAFAQGAERGGIENVGARMAANNQFLAMGGRELSDQEADAVKTAVREENARVFARASIHDRYFNLYDSRSLISSLYMQSPKNGTQLVASLNKIPGAIGNLAFSLSGMQKVAAQSQPNLPVYNYEFPLYGYSLGERADPAYEDPFANETYMLEGDRLERMNLEYGNECFGMVVTRTGDLEYGESGDFTKIPDRCKDTTNAELTHYRFYLGQLINGLTLDCYEGNEDSCRQIGMGDQVGTAPPTGTAGNAIVGDPYTESTTIACDPRTQEVGNDAADGYNDGYTDGRLFKIRLCSIPNIPSSGQADSPGSPFSTPGANGHVIVNSRVSGAWFTLAADAAAAGVNLSAGSSFRSMAHQQDLFRRNPNPDLVARPGYSSHQAGVAIDFSGMQSKGGKTCATRARHSGAAWNWLYNNAEKYGFKQYSVEAWHWDALPVANRCGGP